MLQDIAACLERSGAHVDLDLEELGLDAYWGRDRYETGWVGVSTGNSVGDAHFPVALFGGGLSEANKETAKACYGQYEPG